jgi:hypothetical protein
MLKKWTKILTISGLVLGMLLGTGQDNFFGLRTIDDFAFLLGAGFPTAIIGGIIGLIIDFFLDKKTSFETHVKCPDCRELILKDARKCKHCGCKLIQ